MSRFIPILLLTLFWMHRPSAQVLPTDTLRYHGDISKHINLVVLGDGYTASQQQRLHDDADSLIAYLFRQSPWDAYAPYFNVFVVHVVSADSGIAHPQTATDCGGYNVPVAAPNTYLGVTFDLAGIHRLTGVQNAVNMNKVLAANFPFYDHVLILSNTPHYGGAGGAYAVATLNSQSREVLAHELGHSFAALRDEYYAGDGYAIEGINMTQETRPAMVRWKAWLGVSGTTIAQHCCGGASALWYKPGTNCKMQTNGSPFCPVCKEGIIEAIHRRVTPILAYTPDTLTVINKQMLLPLRLTRLLKPQPNTLKIDWKLDGKIMTQYANQDSIKLNTAQISKAEHRVSVSVTDTSSMLRVTNHGTIHLYTLTWKARGFSTGIANVSEAESMRITAFPIPARDQLQVTLELGHQTPVELSVRDLGGRLVLRRVRLPRSGASLRHTLDVSTLSPGVYLLQVESGISIETLRFTKS